MISVMPTRANGVATPGAMPRSTSHAATSPEIVAAPTADDSIVATVTPICTDARNLFGSDTSRASRRPARPRVAASRCT